jgi:hypothetical protein
MKYIFPILLALLIVACSNDNSKTGVDSMNSDTTVVADFNSPIGGVYGFGDDAQTGPVGSIIIYPESDSTFLFYLDFTRGAPSFNMAQLAERGEIIGDTGIYYSEMPDADQYCKIKFYFRKDFVQIENIDRDCGFGANCMIDHVYDRKSSAVPQFYINPENDTVYFRDLAKEL